MSKLEAPIAVGVTAIIICIIASAALIFSKPDFAPDIVSLSRLCDDITKSNGDFSEISCKHPFCFFAADGTLFENTSDCTITLDEAVKNCYPMKNVYMDGRFYGTAVIVYNADIVYKEYFKMIVACVAFMLSVIIINIVFMILYLRKMIFRPFKKMRKFAESVAQGNLDIAVSMDKKNIFGVFTESFDIMRLELKTARENEEKAVKAKKELISQLSHDIKTPLTSIKTSSELLIAKSDDGQVLKKAEIIGHKANQIDRLITDLFTDSLAELGNLKINITECTNREITDIIRTADYLERTQGINLPDCVLLCDKIRLEQVFGNIIINSYKYADTSISVSAQFSESYLEISFLDYGEGVDEEQLPHLCEQYYRANADKDISGAGLGLYISNALMEMMGGKLKLFSQDGFEAVVMIKLA